MAKAKKQANKPASDAAAAPSPPVVAPTPVAAAVPPFGSSLISKPVLILGLLVGLLSLAIDYLEAPITPHELNFDYAPRTLEQQDLYSQGVGKVPNSLVFDAAQKLLEGKALAAEDLAVSPDGKKAFAGLKDGRIVYFTDGNELTMHEFGRTGYALDTCGQPASENMCGRPLGLAFVNAFPFEKYLLKMENSVTFFHNSTVLMVADAYKGVLIMDANGQKSKVFDSVGLKRFKFLNALAVTNSGQVYVTESSRRFPRNKVTLDSLERQFTGRLIHFDPNTKRVQVIADTLGFPNGLVLVEDEQFLLMAMTFQNKIVKFDLKTKKMEDFAFLPGMPDNLWIEKETNTLFVGLVSLQPWWHPYVLGVPKIRKLLSLVMSTAQLRELASPRGAFAKVDLTNGEITHVYQDTDGLTKCLSGVHAFGDYYYLMTWMRDYIVRIPKKVL